MNTTAIIDDMQMELASIACDPSIAPFQVTACARLAAGMETLLNDAMNEPLPRASHLPLYISQLQDNLSGTENDIESLGGRALESGREDDWFRLKCALTCRDALKFKIQMLTGVQETLRQIEKEMGTARTGFVN